MQDNHLENVRKIQNAEIELIKVFVEICEKEHLMYYMIDGTLLGAVRHKGYIPWDDDADFGMPREDYERFLNVAPKYLPQGIRLSVYNGKDHYYYTISLLSETRKVKRNTAMIPVQQCIWIDIFPLDGMPENPMIERIHQIRVLFLRKLFFLANFAKAVKLNYAHRSWYNRLGVFILRYIPIYKLVSKEKTWQWLDKALKAYPYGESTWSSNMISSYKLNEQVKQTVFGEGTLYDFEGMKLRGPKDYDTYLTQIYGDYMTPPPEAERDKHHVELVDD